MANKYLIILVTLAAIHKSYQTIDNNEVGSEDVNPIAEAASAILKEQNVQNLGSVLNNLLQNGGAKHLGSILGNMGGDGAQLLEGLSSLVGGDGNQGGLNPMLIGAALNFFKANQEYQKPKSDGKTQKTRGGGFDPEYLLSVAKSFMGEQQGGAVDTFMELLPSLLSSASSFIGPEADERARSHSDHASLMPPFLEKLHVYFDHFIHSDMGKNLINLLGAEKIFNIFTDETGRFDYNKFGEMLENHSFRRHWIKIATDRVMGLLKLLSDPNIQKQYVITVPIIVNTFLKGNDFPKKAMLDLSRPSESISALINHVAKKYFGFKISSKEFVKPAIEYVQNLYHLSQTSGFLNNPHGVSDKLADTINLEIIEPIARVNRAFRFAKNVPACDKYVFCLVNEENQNDLVALPELKKMLYRGASLVAGWFISGHSNTPFWTLYDIVTGNSRCKDFYLDKCHDFHLEEVKVTTEYVHNEL